MRKGYFFLTDDHENIISGRIEGYNEASKQANERARETGEKINLMGVNHVGTYVQPKVSTANRSA